MKHLFLIAIALFSFSLEAQPPTRFYSVFGGDGDDIAYSGKQTLDGQYIVAGSSSSYGNHGNTDLYLAKVDSFGVRIWEKFYGGIGNDIGKAVIQLPDSSYVVTGYTNSFGAGSYDFYIIKTDKNGNLVWQNTAGGTDWDFGNDVTLASDGDIVVTGYTSSFGAGKKDGMVVKYSQGGNMIWQKTFGGTENEELRSIIKTNDNFLAAVGYTESRGEINGDGYFLKLNLNGDTLFTRTFGGPYRDYATDVFQKSDNDYILSGAKTFSVNDYAHSYMYSLYGDGSYYWQNSWYASSGDEEFTSVCKSTQATTLSAFVRDVPVSGFKLQGNLFVANLIGYGYKINSFGGGEDEHFYSVESTRDGGYLVVGSTESYNSKGIDIFFMKHDSTCFNYTSVLSIKENSNIIQPFLSYKDDKTANIHLGENAPAKSILLFDLNGRVIRKFNNTISDIEIDLSELYNSIYLVEVIFENGNYYRSKIINR